MYARPSPGVLYTAPEGRLLNPPLAYWGSITHADSGWLTPTPAIFLTRADTSLPILLSLEILHCASAPRKRQDTWARLLSRISRKYSARDPSPITLRGWDRIAEACPLLLPIGRAGACGRVDRKAAYKFLPLREGDSAHAAIDLRAPIAEDWFGFRHMSQLFGAAAPSIRYNFFSRLPTSLLVRVPRLPLLV